MSELHVILGAGRVAGARRWPGSRRHWSRLFKRTFLFTGGEIVGEFLMSTGYLPGAHTPACPVYPHVSAAVAAMWPV